MYFLYISNYLLIIIFNVFDTIFLRSLWQSIFSMAEFTLNRLSVSDWKHCSDVIMRAMASQITSVLGCLLSRWFRRRSKKTPKLCVTGLCEGNSPVWPVNSPQKGLVAWKMFPFDDAIMMFSSVCMVTIVRHPHCFVKLWILGMTPYQQWLFIHTVGE